MNDNAIVPDSGGHAISTEILEEVLVKGNIESLSTEQRLDYYRSVCESVGLNPLTKPFQYIKLNNRLTLYATKDATDQIRKARNVSIVDMAAEQIGDLFRVQVKAQDASGRTEISTGVVSIGGLKGDALANAMMKAETKAKRRVTLSLCGLGMLDESELESIPAQQVQFVEVDAGDGPQLSDADADMVEAEAPADGDVDDESEADTSGKITIQALGKLDKIIKETKIPADALVDDLEYMFGKTSLSTLTMDEGRKLYMNIRKMRDGE